MIIRLNGGLSLNGGENDYYFDDLEIEFEDNVEVPFDDLEFDEDYSEECDDDCDGYCYDCEYGDDEEEDGIDFDLTEDESEIMDYDLFSDERFEIYRNTLYGSLLTDFVRDIRSTDGCPFCVAEIFDIYHDLIVDSLISI